MGVEIEKLLKENNQLKAEILSQGEIGMDRVSYEMQIRDLMEKLRSQGI